MSDPAKATKTPWAMLAVAASLAAFDAIFRLGRIHPDEVFQMLEPALNRAHGYGVLAWEWEPTVGLRNWALPGLISWIIRLGDAIGLSGPWERRVLIEIPQYALHLAMLGAVWRLSARYVGAQLAHWCTWLVALYPPLVWFAGRTMGESISVAFLVWGLERLDAGAEESSRAPLLGGALLGFAEVARYGSAAVIAPAMLWLLVTRRWKTFAFATASGLVVALGLGALDRLTWGDWFHSFIAYVNFNVLSGQAAERFGTNPWYDYFLAFVIAPWAAIGLLLWVPLPKSRAHEAGPRLWLFAVPALVYFAVIVRTPHKEARFLYPTLILLLVAGTPAFVKWARAQLTVQGRVFRTSLVVGSVASVLLYVFLPTPLDVQRPPQFQLSVRAARGETGLAIVNEGMWGSGGNFYLSGNVPFCTCDFPAEGCFQYAMQDPRFNRVISYENRADAELKAQGWTLAESNGPGTLWVR